jgi:hypothetical protein
LSIPGTVHSCKNISIVDCLIKDDSGIGVIDVKPWVTNFNIRGTDISSASGNKKINFSTIISSYLQLPTTSVISVTGLVYSSLIHGNADTATQLQGKVEPSTVVFSGNRLNLGGIVFVEGVRTIVNTNKILQLSQCTNATPQQGDIWREGATIKFYDGTTVKTLAFV